MRVTDFENRCLNRLLLALLFGLLMVNWRGSISAGGAQSQQPKNKAEEIPLAKFVTVLSPIDDRQIARVKNVAGILQNDAVKTDRRAVLVLEFTPGSNEFHQVYGLARFLSSVEVSKVSTVAWIPETLTGYSVVPVLACNEIIMHPDADLGDIGLGETLNPDEQDMILKIIKKHKNLKVSPDLVKGMMDPEQMILKLQMGVAEDNITETRIVTQQEARRRRDNKELIFRDEIVWEGGTAGKLSGTRARQLDVLIVKTAESRLEIAETYNFPSEAMREDPAFGKAFQVRLIKVEGMIDPILEAFLLRQIDRAVGSGANLLIFEIDSPGGYLISSTNLADTIANLDPKQVRTIAYVPKTTYKGAYSGAAIIALGCDEIYMHPEAQIGDAAPIETGAGGQFERVPEKILSSLRGTLRDLAKKKNRPAAVAEAMADKDLLVYQVSHTKTGRIWYMTKDEIADQPPDEWSEGPVVPESRENNLLTVNGGRAHELKLAQAPVNDLDDLKQRLGIPADMKLVAVQKTWLDSLIFVLNTGYATFLLIVLGVALIYLELHLMTGFLGICSVLCFSIFFWSRFLGGTATWLEVVLFVLGLGCIALEIFVIPGFGVFGVSGGLLLIVSLVMASQTFGNLEPNRDIEQMSRTMLTLGASMATVIGMAMVMSQYLPQIPLLNQMVLHPPGMATHEKMDEPRLRPNDVAAGGFSQTFLGKRGEALSDLRPAGKSEIEGEFCDVVSDGPYIVQGSTIEVIEVAGNRIVVRKV